VGEGFAMTETADEPQQSNDDAAHDGGYPPYVVMLEEKRRWDLCLQMSQALFADLDPGERREQVWSATRALYHSDIATGDESEATPE
jgi:hypothetical protein